MCNFCSSLRADRVYHGGVYSSRADSIFNEVLQFRKNIHHKDTKAPRFIKTILHNMLKKFVSLCLSGKKAEFSFPASSIIVFMINQALIEEKLANLPLGNIIFREEVGSTNDLAASLLNKGLPDASVVIADHQTKGRGRDNRKWFTPPDSALAFSLVFNKFQPQIDDKSIPLFTGLGALAVCKALEEDHDLQPQIKWPNDVLLDGKKTCGVLAEAQWEGNQLQAVIIGIGVNIAPPSVPADETLNFPATCIENHLSEFVKRLELLRTILAKTLEDRMRISTPTFIEDWEKRLAYMGEQVQIIENEKKINQGVVSGLDTSGRLILLLEDGRLQPLTTGEIHLRPLVDR